LSEHAEPLAHTKQQGRGIALTIWLASIPLLGFWAYGLFDLDEGYYAAVVGEMNRRGEWITPYFNGHPWFEKPILLYWFAKPSVSLFGEMWGPRLPSVLATVGLFALCGLYLRKRVNAATARWTVIMLGTSLLVLGIGRMMITDALLDLAICGAFLSFYESLVGAKSWRLMTAFCLGLAVLAKGPVSLPFFVALGIWTYIAEPELRPKFKGWWLVGTAILAATVCTWYVPAYLQNGPIWPLFRLDPVRGLVSDNVFFQKFLIEQNLHRFGGGDTAHAVPLLLWPIYYPVILFVGLLPWSVPLCKEFPRTFRSTSSLERYLARWALIILLFFTISGTKLPHYILPAAPPLLMIAGIQMAKRKAFSWKLATAMAVGFCLIVNAAFLSYFYKGGFAELDSDAQRIDQMVGTGRGEVITYELARVSNAKGLSLNDTSDPSLGFYLNQDRITFVDTASFSELQKELTGARGDKTYILTRPGRLDSTDLTNLQSHGWVTHLESPQTNESRYQLLALARIK
jgi:4-amino-4-deoxy-L-arabinose transferase-like glycosyltransferase